MTKLTKEIHEDVLQDEIRHHENEANREKERMEAHQKEIKKDHDKLLKDLHEAEIHHEEKVIERSDNDLTKEQDELNLLEGKPVDEACEKAYEFKKLADEANTPARKILDEDLYETPIQPLK